MADAPRTPSIMIAIDGTGVLPSLDKAQERGSDDPAELSCFGILRTATCPGSMR
jgi:hypothetical protein